MLILLIYLAPIPSYASTHKIAIVIDDLGNDLKGTENMLQLPIPLTVAVMPFLPSSKNDAIKAHNAGKEVIVHLPMEPITGKKSWLGPKPITTDLSDEEIRNRVLAAIKDVPYAVGINNHTGSKATADERVMKIILTVCKEKGLFFLDSKTSPHSVAGKIATNLHVPYIENSIFFDHIASYPAVSRQANLILEQSKTQDILVAIGHVGVPGEITSSTIRKYIPRFEKNAQLSYLSQCLPMSIPNITP